VFKLRHCFLIILKFIKIFVYKYKVTFKLKNIYILYMSHSKKFLTYILFAFSLLIGLHYNENLSGGSKIDFYFLFF